MLIDLLDDIDRANESYGIPRRIGIAHGETALPPVLLPPRRKILKRLRIGRRIEPENAAALADFVGDKILERGHLKSFLGDLIGEMRGDHDDAVAVAQNHVAGKYRRVAAAD